MTKAVSDLRLQPITVKGGKLKTQSETEDINISNIELINGSNLEVKDYILL